MNLDLTPLEQEVLLRAVKIRKRSLAGKISYYGRERSKTLRSTPLDMYGAAKGITVSAEDSALAALVVKIIKGLMNG